MNSIRIKSTAQAIRILVICTVYAVFSASSLVADTVNISVTTDPVITGSGVGMKARFAKIAKVNGLDVDMIGKVLSTTNSKPLVFAREGDDFRFEMMDAAPGEKRTAQVQWSFVESVSGNAVQINDLKITVDDLDGFEDGYETMSTEDAYGYVVDFPTNVTVSQTGSRITAAGSKAQVTTEPDGAIALNFYEKSSITITYFASFSSLYVSNSSKFVHDGNGAFKFLNPSEPPQPPQNLYYTFHFHNPTKEIVRVDFANTLPGGVVWDETYPPVLEPADKSNSFLPIMIAMYQAWLDKTGNSTDSAISVNAKGQLDVKANFSNGGKTVEIQNFDFLQGDYTLILKTKTLPSGGNYANAATIKKQAGNKLELTASATIKVD